MLAVHIPDGNRKQKRPFKAVILPHRCSRRQSPRFKGPRRRGGGCSACLGAGRIQGRRRPWKPSKRTAAQHLLRHRRLLRILRRPGATPSGRHQSTSPLLSSRCLSRRRSPQSRSPKCSNAQTTGRLSWSRCLLSQWAVPDYWMLRFQTSG